MLFFVSYVECNAYVRSHIVKAKKMYCFNLSDTRFNVP